MKYFRECGFSYWACSELDRTFKKGILSVDIIHCLPRRRTHLAVSRIEFQRFFFLFNKWFAFDRYFYFHVSCCLAQLCARNFLTPCARPDWSWNFGDIKKTFSWVWSRTHPNAPKACQVTKLLARKLKTEEKKGLSVVIRYYTLDTIGRQLFVSWEKPGRKKIRGK